MLFIQYILFPGFLQAYVAPRHCPAGFFHVMNGNKQNVRLLDAKSLLKEQDMLSLQAL